MKIISTIVLILAINFCTEAQIELSGGMGITFNSTPSLNDYLNQNGYEQVSDFNSAILFFVEGAYQVSASYDVALEIGYSLSSSTNQSINGKTELSYYIIKPSILNYYVIRGSGYNIKFGGGVGIRILSVEETLPPTLIPNDYHSIGFGFLAKAEGNTSLGGDLFANIGLEVRYDLNGETQKKGNPPYIGIQNKNVNFNSLSFGIRLGLMYRL